jgi:hypothetical protein
MPLAAETVRLDQDYTRYTVLENVIFEVPKRFVILKAIGQGSYGYVW